MIIKSGIISSKPITPGPIRPFCTNFFTSGLNRNDVTGKNGMKITVGSMGFFITHLNRWKNSSGDYLNHVIELCDLDFNILSSTEISNTVFSVNSWAVGALPGPYWCAPGSSFLILSNELAFGDSWIQHVGYENTNIATVDESIINSVTQLPGAYCSVPLDFYYRFAR